MSVAFRCDRCHGYFDPTFMILEDEVFAEISEIVYQNGSDFRRNSVSMREEKLHLCPSCVSEFLKFMRMVKKEGERSNEVDYSRAHIDSTYIDFGSFDIRKFSGGDHDGDSIPISDWDARANKAPERSSSSEKDSSSGSEV